MGKAVNDPFVSYWKKMHAERVSGSGSGGLSSDGLFDEGCAIDLFCRGFGRKHVMDMTGDDIGYHGSRLKSCLSDIDRFGYKVKHCSVRISCRRIGELIEAYASGASKEEVISGLGLFGDHEIPLKKLFAELGFADQFREADAKHRKDSMTEGSVRKFGTDNVFKLKGFQDKAKATRKERYGAEYTLQEGSVLADGARKTFAERMEDDDFHDSVINKRKATTRERFGVDFSSQSSAVREKIINTNMERYGFSSPMKNDAIKAKTMSTNLERYGAVTFLHSDKGKEVSRNSCMERYGVPYYSQTDEARSHLSDIASASYWEKHDKMKETMLSRYGVEWNMQRPEMRNLLADYCKEHRSDVYEKSVNTSLERYGVSHHSKMNEFRLSQSERMSDLSHQAYISRTGREKTGCVFDSSLEERCYDLLVGYFGEDDVAIHYSDYRYPYECDFHIGSIDAFIELNGFWTHGNHWFDPSDESDMFIADKWSASGDFYINAAYTWTDLDVRKRVKACENKLNYVVFWNGSNLYDVELWLSMGCPFGTDYNDEYSWVKYDFFDFDLPIPDKLSFGNCITASRSAQCSVFYKEEIALCKKGRSDDGSLIIPGLLSNRYHYLHKLPDELSLREILNGFKISGLCKGYSSFDNSGMLVFLNRYSPSFLYDPCSGWGERMLTCFLNGIRYIGCDCNKDLSF